MTAPVIVAIASPPGRSLRGIVRMAGARCLELAAECMSPLSARRSVASTCFALGDATLPVDVVVYRGPASYTGEDAVEIIAPGNPLLLERIMTSLLEAAVRCGIDARSAEPGEFTYRAYRAGRLDLDQAEGVATAIAARSDAELAAARVLANDALACIARTLMQRLAESLALVEAGIDFTDEEDVVAIAPDDLAERIDAIDAEIARVLERAVGLEAIEGLPWVVLDGPPNAGKSTLFNALLGRERAVVSDVAGTTRDVIAEPLRLDGAEVLLVDVAGEESAQETIEEAMQGARRDAIARADLVLRCSPPGEALAAATEAVLPVRTKADLVGDVADGVSARTGAGIPELRAAIAGQLARRGVSLAADALIVRPRHDSAMRSVRRFLEEARVILEVSRGQRHIADAELVAATLRHALDDLGLVAGSITPDDVLGLVFSRFCVGK